MWVDTNSGIIYSGLVNTFHFTKTELTYKTVQTPLEQLYKVVAHLLVVVVIMSDPLDGLNVVPY